MAHKKYERGLVSIGFPVYNGAARPERLAHGAGMRRALESLLNQTYQNTEIIISDNASTDDTENICREYAARDPRIRYVRQPTNLTQITNVECVIKSARGEYFVLGADDDWWHPEFVERLKNILDSHPDYGLAIGSVRRVYADGEMRDEVIYEGRLQLTGRPYEEVFYMMSSEWPVHWFCGVFRTELLNNLLKIPWPRSKSHDRVFMCELSLATHIYSVPDILHHKTVYRQPASARMHEFATTQYIGAKKQSIYVWTMISRLIRSHNIPLSRKLRIYPYHLTAFVWRNRVFLREWFPRAFALALWLKGMVKRRDEKRI